MMESSPSNVKPVPVDTSFCEDNEEPESTEVKSSAVVKCQVAETPCRFMKLTTETDLNEPPANWLRSSAKLPLSYLPCNSHKAFSSFTMADSFPDCVGEVDVVSDAENIKKLLKIPFSKTHVSMMVHRIGKTLLLDEFDVHSHLLRASQKQWEWLKKFYYEQVLESLDPNDKCFKKNKSRDHLQNKYMLSKFLHYSTMENSELGDEEEEFILGMEEAVEDVETLERPKVSSPVRSYLSKDLQKSPTPPVEATGQEFLRNVLWTFEDIRMLIGSDLPIFGGGTHPVVTLRLRDVSKPINVLTGLDYWLDNLMCNVPDVVMCYHLNGIVQQYELIKTEDIPQLEGSHFSPKVVKDVAQNILSFLKAKATKCGHTYWLFRGRNEDVVKLYDLTTLCEETDSERNPFTLPVAMLLFKVARNMKDGGHTCTNVKEGDMKERVGTRNKSTIHRLLLNCLMLLDPKEHPKIVASVHSLLTDLYLPENVDPNHLITTTTTTEQDSTTCAKENSETDSSATCSETEDDDEDEEEDVSLLEVRTLCVPCKYQNPRSENQKAFLGKNWNDRCISALKHVLKGLECIKYVCPMKAPANEENEEVTYFGSRAESIPLPFEPLGKQQMTKEDSQVIQQSNQWLSPYKIRLLYKGAQAYSVLAELALANMHLGSALRKVQLAFILYESAKNTDNQNGEDVISLLSCLLSLAGDCHALLCKQNPEGRSLEEKCFKQQSELDLKFRDYSSVNEINSDFGWCWIWNNESMESQLLLSCRCYSSAVSLYETPKETKKKPLKTEDKQRWEKLVIRGANICNELGVYYMNSAMKLWSEKGGTSSALASSIPDLPVLLSQSREYLTKGLCNFRSIGDKLNQALLHSNLARLARLEASLAVPFTNDTGQRKEFSPTEGKKHREAVNQYRQALSLLNGLSQPELSDNIRWDLCTSLFTAACLLQDYAPLSKNAQEKVEEEVCDWLQDALRLCKECHTNSPRYPLYQYRMAGVLHRLASLHHHAYRNQVLDERRQKRHRESADSYYANSADLFLELGNVTEFLRVLLERIALWEHIIGRQSGFSSCVKSLLTVLRHTTAALPLLKQVLNGISNTETCKPHQSSEKQVKSEEDVQSQDFKYQLDGLLTLLQDRLVYLLASLTKTYSSKASKYGHALTVWNNVKEACRTSQQSGELQSKLETLLHSLQLVDDALRVPL